MFHWVNLAGTLTFMASRQQRVITIGVVVLAFVALGLGIAFQGDRSIDGPALVGGGGLLVDGVEPGDSSQSAGGDSPGSGAVSTSPIEGFFPKSGEGGGCSEPVGVDLAEGYGATLTINGTRIAPEAMNVTLNPDGSISDQLTAGRSLGHYTFGPEENCPNGSMLRATDNVLEVCVYRLLDGPNVCETTEYRFDVI